MSIGFGVFLIVVGAIIAFAYTGNIPYVDDDILGGILIAAGVVAIILGIVVNSQRSRSKHIQETRYRGPEQPPRA